MRPSSVGSTGSAKTTAFGGRERRFVDNILRGGRHGGLLVRADQVIE